ncbi:hypothetical protein [Aquisalimonas sp.]|uniref:hypothetical protein n=1 Tax=Aquisalimonas sp. TaxID=1872621 RepID=UPI0025BF134F|nr:hypothetical protein [Aquisalimonas sp.]
MATANGSLNEAKLSRAAGSGRTLFSPVALKIISLIASTNEQAFTKHFYNLRFSSTGTSDFSRALHSTRVPQAGTNPIRGWLRDRYNGADPVRDTCVAGLRVPNIPPCVDEPIRRHPLRQTARPLVA